MDILLPILGMLAVVGCSGLLARSLPRIPLPLIQIAAGAAMGWPAWGLHLQFDAKIFMLLFVPPMLFADGWEMPKREFGRNKWAILVLSTVLILFTVGVLGYFIYLVLPGMPLSVAFLLAAVLSPTDAVAVSAIVQRLRMPPRLQHILAGEALMNDAAALIAVKFAVTATLTASFSLPHAALDFVAVAVGGALVGIVFSWLLKQLHDRLLYWREGQVTAPTVILLLMVPFVPYLIAEHLHLSGVLAAVAAGMTASAFDVRSSRFNAAHVETQNIWEVIRFAFNGLIFTLVGLQLPALLKHLPVPAHVAVPTFQSVTQLVMLTLAITTALLTLRFLGLVAGAWLARKLITKRSASPRHATPSVLWAGLGALGGTRGGITLAAVLGVPVLMPDGSGFPARDLLVFQSAAVIVLSLLVASVGLPWLLRRMAQPDGNTQGGREAVWARNRASRAALRTIETAPLPLEPGVPGDSQTDNNKELVSHIRSRVHQGYLHRLLMSGGDQDGRQAATLSLSLERKLRLEALQSERQELHELRLAHRINDETLRELTREIDLVEIVVRSQPG